MSAQLADHAARNERDRQGQAALYGDRTEHFRQPPQSIESEQSVLGGLILDNRALAKVQDWLAEDDFFRRDHQLIYRAILELSAKRQPYDAVTLGEWFEAQGQAEMVAGGAYLSEMASTTPSAANIVAYAEIVREKSALRKLIDLGTEVVNSGFQPGGRDAREVAAEAQRTLALLSDARRIGGAKGMREVGKAWYNELVRRNEQRGSLIGLPTPWAKFNAMTAGLQAGQLVVVAGRPSMGKSAWAINVATANALSGKRVLFFNLEMTDAAIYNRAVASIASVPLSWLRSPSESDDDSYWSRAGESVAKLNDAGLLIDDSPGLRREQIIARARREHLRKPLDMLIVDHLHLIPLAGKTRETVEIGEITRDLKALAKEMGIPIILLSQLNRSLEARVNKRPIMADLRESGNIEQDADLIVFLYRDDYYADRESRPSEYPGMVEIIIAKQREGEAGRIWARDALAFGRIDDHEGEVAQPQVSQPARNRRGMGGIAYSAGNDA